MRRFVFAEDLPPGKLGSKDYFLSLVTPLLYEQFPWQEPLFNDLARSHAWLVSGLEAVETAVVTPASLAEIVGGMLLTEAIGATFFLKVAATENNGSFDFAWLQRPEFSKVLELYPRTNIESTVRRLTTTPAAYRQSYETHALKKGHLARYDYNPLSSTPFVDLGVGSLVAPAQQLIMRTVTPHGLYYAGVRAHGNQFAEDLGTLFEHYIGRNLRLISNGEVHAEISYGPRKGKRSVDWLIVMPELVLLVECKLKRLGLSSRAGESKLLDELGGSLRRAREQLATTVENLAAGTPEFADIPTDRPILAVIVTAEPIYPAAAYLLGHDQTVISAGKLPDVRVAIASASDIENLVTHGNDVGGVLLEVSARNPVGAIALREVLPHPEVRNSILEDAWNSYPWPELSGS